MSDAVKKLPVLPTGKPHISFSELSTWLQCPYRHKLLYVDGVGTFDGNEHTFFGTHVHFGCEMFIKNREMQLDVVLDRINDTWNERSFSDKDRWISQARGILEDVPPWMDNAFPGWEPIAAELMLYESLAHLNHPDVSWKGLVDAAIRHKNGRGAEIVRIMDWKTTAWGWHRDKLRDFTTNAQAAAYKIFWSRKFNVAMSDIRTNFVLLKREGRPGQRCQLIEVSVGQKTEERVNSSIDKMLRAVKSGHAQKNKLSCKFCEFNASQHCEGVGNRLK
jgi:hypothetical protein